MLIQLPPTRPNPPRWSAWRPSLTAPVFTVEDALWHFVDASGETIILVGLEPGPHKVLIELADPCTQSDHQRNCQIHGAGP
jgi:hypothetical protein